MSDISSIGSGGLGSVGPISRTGLHTSHANGTPQSADPATNRLDLDRVEVSEHARFLDLLRRLPEVRLNRIDEIRQSIAAGEYVTEEKLDVALDRLLTEEL